MSEPAIGAEAAAKLARLFVKANAVQTDRIRSLVGRIGARGRGEAREAAARLDAIAELFTVRMAEFGESADWAVDTTDVVASEVAAELRLSQRAARDQLRLARAMTERLPRVADVFRTGDIDLQMFKTVVSRTDMITNDLVLSFVDAELSAGVGSWTALTRGRLKTSIDAVVARVDRDAVRQRRETAAERSVWIGDRPDGLADIIGTAFASTAHALDKKLTALARTVCGADPRTLDARRSDALLALVAGAQRMTCQCGDPQCPAAAAPGVSPVVIHVIAEQGTMDGRGDTPGYDLGNAALIPPEVLAELAATAKLRPLIHPGDAPPEDRYTPSKALADFVRARDLTCRAPGCDQPAVHCDVDHTIPYGMGGLTHASNLKCLCRLQLRETTLRLWTVTGFMPQSRGSGAASLT